MAHTFPYSWNEKYRLNRLKLVCDAEFCDYSQKSIEFLVQDEYNTGKDADRGRPWETGSEKPGITAPLG